MRLPPPPPPSQEEFSRRWRDGARTLRELDPAFASWYERNQHPIAKLSRWLFRSPSPLDRKQRTL